MAKKKKDKIPHTIKKRHLMSTYGISPETYMGAFGAQAGRCAICNKKQRHMFDKFTSRVGKMCVDHCHKSGRARALLCSHCNTALGMFMDDQRIVGNALNYLKFFEITNSGFLCDAQSIQCDKQAGKPEGLATIKQVWSITHRKWIRGSPPKPMASWEKGRRPVLAMRLHKNVNLN